MSTSESDTQTSELDLSRTERWVVHHVLVEEAETALDREERPEAWIYELFESVESSDVRITLEQAVALRDALTTYVLQLETPQRDVDPAKSISITLEDAFDLD